MATSQPKVGCILLIHDDKGNTAFLLRQNTGWMDGFYGAPGGKIEKGESYTDAAIREAYEEVGITIKPEDLQFFHIVQLNVEDEWIHIVFDVNRYDGTPYNREPDVHAELAWFPINKIPVNTIPANKHVLQNIKRGLLYTELTASDL